MNKLFSRIARFLKHNLGIILIGIAIILLVVTQVRTFVQDGEILGFQVVERSRKASGSGLANVKNETENSLVCRVVDEKFISDLVGKQVTKATMMADVKKPNYYSSCIYRTDVKLTSKDVRLITVSYQKKQNSTDAEKEVVRIKERKGSKIQKIEGLADEAYFDETKTQLVVRKGNEVISVYINSGDKDAIDELEASKKIAQKLMNSQIQ